MKSIRSSASRIPRNNSDRNRNIGPPESRLIRIVDNLLPQKNASLLSSNLLVITTDEKGLPFTLYRSFLIGHIGSGSNNCSNGSSCGNDGSTGVHLLSLGRHRTRSKDSN
ncbi:hypothetical protein ACS0PU_012826 [Formica fusca]